MTSPEAFHPLFWIHELIRWYGERPGLDFWRPNSHGEVYIKPNYSDASHGTPSLNVESNPTRLSAETQDSETRCTQGIECGAEHTFFALYTSLMPDYPRGRKHDFDFGRPDPVYGILFFFSPPFL
ncbi:hypothetical protein DFH09DRAFT_1098507 [Mycena vulgaris]|nr:hypothetical protein DFH09DRAFT_1098507 [Mycena vulgaris]